MSDLAMFLKKNKAIKENVFFAATKSLNDESGKPLMWELQPVSTRQNNAIQEQSMVSVSKKGNQKLNTSKYMIGLAAASVVFPDLYNAELQDSYGANTPEDLIQEMIDDSGEWNAFIQFVTEYNGFVPLQDDIEEAKN